MPDALDYQRQTTPGRRVLSVFFWVGLSILALIMASIILPPFVGRYRPYGKPPRMRCASNLRQIGLANQMYCDENQNQYPDQVEKLIPTQGLSAEVFVCPSSGDMRLTGAAATQPAGTLLSGNFCSYVYVGVGMTATANKVIAFDLPGNHAMEGGNVLYGDGRVNWERFEMLVQLVPELETGRNPPVLATLSPAQAKKLYQQKWAPKLASLKDGTWAASLPSRGSR